MYGTPKIFFLIVALCVGRAVIDKVLGCFLSVYTVYAVGGRMGVPFAETVVEPALVCGHVG
jgi:hypothetical protein